MATTKRNLQSSKPTHTTTGTSTRGKAIRRAGAQSAGRAGPQVAAAKDGDAGIATAARPRKHAVPKRTPANKGAARPRSRLDESKPAGDVFRSGSKGAAIVALLSRKDGATITELSETTGWQAHSVRGFLSGSLKKKLGIEVASEKGSDGQRRYRIAS